MACDCKTCVISSRKASWWCRTRGSRSCKFYIARSYSSACWPARSAGSRTRSFITDCHWIPWHSPEISTPISCSSPWSRYRRTSSPGCWLITSAVNQRSLARSCWAGHSASRFSSYRQVKKRTRKEKTNEFLRQRWIVRRLLKSRSGGTGSGDLKRIRSITCNHSDFISRHPIKVIIVTFVMIEMRDT